VTDPTAFYFLGPTLDGWSLEEVEAKKDTGWKPMLHCSFASPTLTGEFPDLR